MSFMGSLPSGFDFTRGTDAWDFDPTRALEQSGQNIPRFDHSPFTGEALGLLLENGVQNGIRNPKNTGTVTGSPGTLPTYWASYTPVTDLTRTVVGTGTEFGMPYVDVRLEGTPSTSGQYYHVMFESGNVITAAVGQTWTVSSYMRLVGGSASGLSGMSVGMDEQNGGGYLVGGSCPAVIPTSDLMLLSHTRTLTAPTVNSVKPVSSFRFSSGAVDATIRFYAPLMELGLGLSSRIQGNMAATTRGKDSCLMTPIPWYNPNAFSFVFEFMPGADAADWIYPLIFSAGDSSADSIGIQFSPGNAPRAVVRTGNVVQADLIFSDVAPTQRGQKYRFGVALDATSIYACVNGGTILEDTSLTLPSGIDRVRLGSSTSGPAVRNGNYRRLWPWNYKVPKAVLQRYTTL